MEPTRFKPSGAQLVAWVAGAGVCAVAVGKAVAGFCAVMAYPPGTGFTPAFVAAWLLGALAALAYFLSLRYTLDKHHLTKTAGVLWRCRRSVPLAKITTIAVRQGPLDRLLRIGQVWIYTPSSGSEVPEERLVGMRDPAAVRDAILQQAEAVLPATTESVLQEKREIVALLSEIRDRLARLEEHLVPPAPTGVGPAPTATATPPGGPRPTST
jgi:membrane protein YdbS with pleckstrin-like domain